MPVKVRHNGECFLINKNGKSSQFLALIGQAESVIGLFRRKAFKTSCQVYDNAKYRIGICKWDGFE